MDMHVFANIVLVNCDKFYIERIEFILSSGLISPILWNHFIQLSQLLGSWASPKQSLYNRMLKSLSKQVHTGKTSTNNIYIVHTSSRMYWTKYLYRFKKSQKLQWKTNHMTQTRQTYQLVDKIIIDGMVK